MVAKVTPLLPKKIVHSGFGTKYITLLAAYEATIKRKFSPRLPHVNSAVVMSTDLVNFFGFCPVVTNITTWWGGIREENPSCK
mmetsp:Transcript_48864/g.57082  ORF Transcript_48864/g.57082 Transcript_48864/m.57082 type:complete len:83 (-) Transcript_48864:274-522(-)